MKEEIQGKLDIQFDAKKETSTQSPVTCLGMEFENDEARRAYFREELRKKLPELKQIEGYPIGEDDDIINLSDPPYYTACPNPWQNDFIDEWENEKKKLEERGLRREGFEIKSPYASDVSEGKNNPIYNAHSYHTKVPHPAIMRYLLHYTQPGDIVFDGFAGTGMTGVAASLCEDNSNDVGGKIGREFQVSNTPIRWGKRHAVLSDLSPVASLISGVYNSPITSDSIKEMYLVLNDAKSKYGWMYETLLSDGQIAKINYTVWSDVFICPHCGNEVVFTKAAVDLDTNKIYEQFPCPTCNAELTKKSMEKCWESFYDTILGQSIQRQKKVPVFINYSIGKTTGNKEVSKTDIEVMKKSEELASKISFWPDRMMEGSEARRNDRQGITHVHQFYFPKSLVILSYILSRSDKKELKFLVNSQLINVSKLNRFRPGISFPYNPLSGTLYIGSQISESNVFVALENKIKKLQTAFSLLNADNLTGVSSATHVLLKDESIDYIFTDPPFGANISYSELNCIQETWLKVKTNYTEEAIVNESHLKGREEYQELMIRSLKEYYRILKPGKWITIEFSNTSAAIWNTIQDALQVAGFVLASVAALDKQTGSFKAVTSTTAVKQDLVITCYKPSHELVEKIDKSLDHKNSAWDFIQEYLNHLTVHYEKGNKTTTVIERSPKILYDKLISYYVRRGLPVPMDAQEFQTGLRDRYVERDGMFFTSKQAAEYEEKRKHTDGFAPMGIIVSDEANGIEWLRNMLDGSPKTYQEIQPEWMQAINGLRKGDILPELRTILEENFIEMEDGRWRKPDLHDNVDLEMVHTKALLREFNLYKEQAAKPRAKLKEVRVEALRAGFYQCYISKDFATIVMICEKIPENLLAEDEQLLQYYDMASSRV